jgi:hypothetical protein
LSPQKSISSAKEGDNFLTYKANVVAAGAAKSFAALRIVKQKYFQGGMSVPFSTGREEGK